MSDYSTIRCETDARGVATLWLARSDKHNALSAQMIAELTHAAGALSADEAVRVVILAAEGRSFCAGGDLGWMQEQMTADAATRAVEARKLALMLKALNEIPTPVIGRVQGNAFGGGLGMMSVCDVVICDEAARFGLTETRLGLIPATIGPYVVARIGVSAARRVFMSPRLFGAEEAVALGFAARAVPIDALDAAIAEQVDPYLDAAPGAVAEAKGLLMEMGAGVSDALVDLSIDALVTRWESDESSEGIEAFFAKRKANWMRS